MPLFLSVALGLTALQTGVRLLPLSATLLLAAAGVPRVWPKASPRRVTQAGLLALLGGIVSLLAALDAGAGPEITTWPMLLAGLGIGALASQLGAVTISSVPDEQSSEVGGLQNTFTNLGASLGTALAGSVLIASLTAAFLSGIAQNPAVPKEVTTQATTQLAAGAPFMSDAQLQVALDKADVPPETSAAIVDENSKARIEALRAALAVLAFLAVLSLFFTRRIPMNSQATSRRRQLRWLKRKMAEIVEDWHWERSRLGYREDTHASASLACAAAKRATTRGKVRHERCTGQP